MNKKLWKTTIVIWTEDDPTGTELDELAREATELGAYCSKQVAVLIDVPKADPDWDGTEFFGVDETEDMPPTCPLCACSPQFICGKEGCHHCQAWASGRDVGWLDRHDAGDDNDFICNRGDCANEACNGDMCLGVADVNDDSDEDFATWCHAMETTTDSREAWKEWRDKVEPRVLELQAKLKNLLAGRGEDEPEQA